MVSTRYARDYRLCYQKDGEGAGRTELLYIGPLYRFTIEQEAVNRICRRLFLLLCGLWACFFFGAIFENGMMRSAWISIPYICMAIPLVYFSAGLYTLKVRKGPLERIHKERSVDRLKAQSFVAILLDAAALAASAWRLCSGAAAWRQSAAFLASLVVFAACAASSFMVSRALEVKEEANPLAQGWADKDIGV